MAKGISQKQFLNEARKYTLDFVVFPCILLFGILFTTTLLKDNFGIPTAIGDVINLLGGSFLVVAYYIWVLKEKYEFDVFSYFERIKKLVDK